MEKRHETTYRFLGVNVIDFVIIDDMLGHLHQSRLESGVFFSMVQSVYFGVACGRRDRIYLWTRSAGNHLKNDTLRLIKGESV